MPARPGFGAVVEYGLAESDRRREVFCVCERERDSEIANYHLELRIREISVHDVRWVDEYAGLMLL